METGEYRLSHTVQLAVSTALSPRTLYEYGRQLSKFRTRCEKCKIIVDETALCTHLRSHFVRIFDRGAVYASSIAVCTHLRVQFLHRLALALEPITLKEQSVRLCVYRCVRLRCTLALRTSSQSRKPYIVCRRFPRDVMHRTISTPNEFIYCHSTKCGMYSTAWALHRQCRLR